MVNKNIEIGFQSAVCHLCVSEHYCAMIEIRTQRPLFRAEENRQSTSYNFNIKFDFEFYSML